VFLATQQSAPKAQKGKKSQKPQQMPMPQPLYDADFNPDEILTGDHLWVDLEALDAAAMELGLKQLWKSSIFDASGKYDQPNMRTYLRALTL
jgi:hypothetical protein